MRKPFYTTEEAPTNNVGSGAIAGISDPVGPNDLFAGAKCFDIDTGRYMKCRHGRKKREHYRKYVGDDDVGEAIRQYGRKNPKAPLLVRDKSTGAMMYLNSQNESFSGMYVCEDKNITLDQLKSDLNGGHKLKWLYDLEKNILHTWDNADSISVESQSKKYGSKLFLTGTFWKGGEGKYHWSVDNVLYTPKDGPLKDRQAVNGQKFKMYKAHKTMGAMMKDSDFSMKSKTD